MTLPEPDLSAPGAEGAAFVIVGYRTARGGMHAIGSRLVRNFNIAPSAGLPGTVGSMRIHANLHRYVWAEGADFAEALRRLADALDAQDEDAAPAPRHPELPHA